MLSGFEGSAETQHPRYCHTSGIQTRQRICSFPRRREKMNEAAWLTWDCSKGQMIYQGLSLCQHLRRDMELVSGPSVPCSVPTLPFLPSVSFPFVIIQAELLVCCLT